MPDAPYAYVLVLTAESDEAQARAAMEAGADDLVIKPFDPAELERTLIAAQRVTGLHRRMHSDARQDTLTGIGNRLRLAEDLDALCGRVTRYGHAYCVALLDVDRFKALNDSAGHRAGDEVLRKLAAALAATIRRGDTLYRYRGVPRAAPGAVARRRPARRRAPACRGRGPRAGAPGGRHGDGQRRHRRPRQPGLLPRRAVRARRPGALPRRASSPSARTTAPALNWTCRAPGPSAT